MKAINIVESAYRGTLEEQDDTIVWLTHAMKGAGADIDLLLRGPAVNYLVKNQRVAPLRFGERHQAHAPEITAEVQKLMAKGARVFVLRDDHARYGLDEADTLDGVEPVAMADLPGLFAGYDRLFHW